MIGKSWNDYKARVSIIQVAKELGYLFDKSKGLSRPHFVLKNQSGVEVDSIYISNPQNNATQGYWRRTVGAGRSDSGDLIGFIKENLNSFPESVGARNEVDAVNRILERLSGEPRTTRELLQSFAEEYKGWTPKPFRLERYEREGGNVKTAMRFLASRGISEETAILFQQNYEIIRDTESKFNYKNLAFPYHIPGKEEVVGYEIRGYNGFKSKAEGTNSSEGCWIAYLGDNGYAGMVSELHIAESALDIMAYVQIKKEMLDLQNSVFVSFGGSFSDKQMKGLLEAFPTAKPVLHFDNDLNGVLYDCRCAALMAGKELKCRADAQKNMLFTLGEKQFSIPVEEVSYATFRKASGLREYLKVEKAPEQMKDWNDVLMQPTGQREGEKEDARQDYQMKKRV